MCTSNVKNPEPARDEKPVDDWFSEDNVALCCILEVLGDEEQVDGVRVPRSNSQNTEHPRHL